MEVVSKIVLARLEIDTGGKMLQASQVRLGCKKANKEMPALHFLSAAIKRVSAEVVVMVLYPTKR